MHKSNLKILDTVAQYGIQVNSSSRAKCPWHNDTHPSLHINIKKNAAYCNVCGIKLDPIGFMMKYENISFNDLIRRIEGDDKPSKEVIARQKRKQQEARRNERLVARAIEVAEDYLVMLDDYRYMPTDSDEFAVYCHNLEYVRYVEGYLFAYKKDFSVILPWINENVGLLKRMAEKEAIFGEIAE